ncbi:MAG: homocysteine S-methyltransferase family protein, partial [Huintestinicola sp.]
MNKKEQFQKLLKDNEFVLLDGAMGTMLQAGGLKTGEVPELLNLSRPEFIEDIHRRYIEAGAQIVYANTFGANAYKLAETGKSVQ